MCSVYMRMSLPKRTSLVIFSVLRENPFYSGGMGDDASEIGGSNANTGIFSEEEGVRTRFGIYNSSLRF